MKDVITEQLDDIDQRIGKVLKTSDESIPCDDCDCCKAYIHLCHACLEVMMQNVRKDAKKEFTEMIDKMAKKKKATQTNIGEYDKFISVHDLKEHLEAGE